MSNTRKKRKAFCRSYLNSGNVREAALRSGFSPETAEDEGLRLLENPACRRYLAELNAHPALPIQSLVISGLSRLAFGAVNDAAALAFSDEPLTREMLADYDLFHVVSIRRERDKGTVEIKFADRQKAMEKLLECAHASDSSAAAAALLSALGGSDGEVDCDEHPDQDHGLFGEAENGSDMVECPGDPAL
ncbi:MAG: terminase small subunit [Oscillospiraceae bacterium]|nr:terminase small subunit [Oscillospiraceae bacterium]